MLLCVSKKVVSMTILSSKKTINLKNFSKLTELLGIKTTAVGLLLFWVFLPQHSKMRQACQSLLLKHNNLKIFTSINMVNKNVYGHTGILADLASIFGYICSLNYF